jgi:hypothetical protein
MNSSGLDHRAALLAWPQALATAANWAGIELGIVVNAALSAGQSEKNRCGNSLYPRQHGLRAFTAPPIRAAYLNGNGFRHRRGFHAAVLGA